MMKNYQIVKKVSLPAIFLLGLFTLLSSCTKESTTINTSNPVALVTAIQASPDEPALDFFLSNQKVNSAPFNYGDGIDYFQANAGTNVASFYKYGTAVKVIADTITLTANTAYSLFLVNTVSNPQVLLVTDSLSKPSSGNASVRFINLSPDSQPVTLSVQNSQVLASNKAFKGVSSFIPLPGDVVYNFSVTLGTSSTVLATQPNMKLQSGSVYTIWLHGLNTPANSTDGLKVDYTLNAYY